MTSTTEAPSPEELEARARKLMAERHIARGWDTQRARSQWLADVDQALDNWLATNA